MQSRRKYEEYNAEHCSRMLAASSTPPTVVCRREVQKAMTLAPDIVAKSLSIFKLGLKLRSRSLH
jgi:hypothetical protein